jgi:hypothetical protein
LSENIKKTLRPLGYPQAQQNRFLLGFPVFSPPQSELRQRPTAPL